MDLFKNISREIPVRYVFIAKDNPKERIPKDSGIDHIDLDLPDKLFFKNDMGPGLGIRGLFRLLTREIGLLKNEEFDIIVTSTQNSIHTHVAFLYSKIRKKRIYIWTETWNIPKRYNFIQKLYYRYNDQFLKYSNGVLSHGTNTKRYCLGIGIPKDRIIEFNHCSSDKSLERIYQDFIQSLGLKEKTVILYFGRLVKRKGLEFLLEAFQKIEREHSEAYLLIVGRGEEEKYFKDLSRELNIKNVNFYGFIDFKYAASVFSASDIFCLPSYVYENSGGEGWGLVLNEACSMGLPIVTTDAVGGAPDLVIEGNNGFIIRNGNSDALYHALSKLVADGGLRKTMSINSRAIFERFNNYEVVVNNLKKGLSTDE